MGAPDEGGPARVPSKKNVSFAIRSRQEFCQALKVEKGPPDDGVKRSLFQRAVGYTLGIALGHDRPGPCGRVCCERMCNETRLRCLKAGAGAGALPITGNIRVVPARARDDDEAGDYWLM